MPLGGSHFTIRKATRSPTAPGLTPPAGGHTLDYERGLRRLSKVSTFDGKLVHFRAQLYSRQALATYHLHSAALRKTLSRAASR